MFRVGSTVFFSCVAWWLLIVVLGVSESGTGLWVRRVMLCESRCMDSAPSLSLYFFWKYFYFVRVSSPGIDPIVHTFLWNHLQIYRVVTLIQWIAYTVNWGYRCEASADYHSSGRNHVFRDLDPEG